MIESEGFGKFFESSSLKRSLTLAGLFLVAYELLKSTITENIRDFYTFDYVDGKPKPDPQYKAEVTRLDDDLLYASCLWLQRNNVISQSEVKEIQDIRRHRNLVAHELPLLIIEPGHDLNLKYLSRIQVLQRKIEEWWVLNVLIPTHPEYDQVDIDIENVQLARASLLEYVVLAAQGEKPT